MRRQRKHSQCGTTLLEALIAIVIFAVGMLGIAGLQLKSMNASTDARSRATASMFAEELSSLAAADFSNATKYTTTGTPVVCNDTVTNSACDRWLAKVKSTLPSGAAIITYDATASSADYGLFTVTISWTSAFDASSTNSYKSLSNLRALQALPQT